MLEFASIVEPITLSYQRMRALHADFSDAYLRSSEARDPGNFMPEGVEFGYEECNVPQAVVSGSPAERAIALYGQFCYADGQDAKRALRQIGAIKCDLACGALAMRVNAEKNRLGRRLRVLEAAVEKAAGVKGNRAVSLFELLKSVDGMSYAKLKKAGMSKLSILQATRHIPIIRHPLKISFSVTTNTVSVKRVTATEAIERLQLRDYHSEAYEMDMQRALALPKSEELAIRAPKAPHFRANIWTAPPPGEKKPRIHQRHVAMPFLVVCRGDQDLPVIVEPKPVKQRDGERSDATICDQAYLTTIRAHRYREQA